MRLLAIGDIHGCYRALTTLVEAVELTSEDLLVTLGDYVNRGPGSKAVLDWLIDRQQTGRLVPLRGNHEIMMLQARQGPFAYDNWLAVGGVQTLESYSPCGDPGHLTDIPEAHWEFLENDLLPYHETDRHFFVHANADPEQAMEKQSAEMLYWVAINEWTPAHSSGKTMICGHTSQKSGEVLNLGHAVCIDTAACRGGWLTCLDVETGDYWQANEAGETRQAFLD